MGSAGRRCPHGQVVIFILLGAMRHRTEEVEQRAAGAGPAAPDHLRTRCGHRRVREGVPHPARSPRVPGKGRSGGGSVVCSRTKRKGEGAAGAGPAASGHLRPRKRHRRHREAAPRPSRSSKGVGEGCSSGNLRWPRTVATAKIGGRGHGHSGGKRRGGEGSVGLGEASGGENRGGERLACANLGRGQGGHGGRRWTEARERCSGGRGAVERATKCGRGREGSYIAEGRLERTQVLSGSMTKATAEGAGHGRARLRLNDDEIGEEQSTGRCRGSRGNSTTRRCIKTMRERTRTWAGTLQSALFGMSAP